MRTTRSYRAVLTALTFAAACADGPPRGRPPTEPSEPPPFQAGLDQERNERLARRLALALRRPEVRADLATAVAGSPHPEGKVHFQWLVGAEGGRLRRELAQASGEALSNVEEDVALAMSLEVYFPVPDHRARWQGGDDLLVATAIRDGEVPVAFDLAGDRLLLDPGRPPSTPVLAVVPAEHFYVGPHPMGEFWDGDLGSGTNGNVSGTIGLFMTYASFTQTFESWLKGSPEFEVHVLGPSAPGSSMLTTLQCAGEHAGGPYAYDQNAKTWSGSVMLFSQTQLDQFKAQFPGQALRILVLEDDDGPCRIKQDSNRLENLFKVLDAAYGSWTGGRDTTVTVSKYFRKAKALYAVISALASLIKTNDEIVGTAIEDQVAGQTWPGANWIVKGENNVTNGGLRLEMR